MDSCVKYKQEAVIANLSERTDYLLSTEGLPEAYTINTVFSSASTMFLDIFI